jgi:hypothetical protein
MDRQIKIGILMLVGMIQFSPPGEIYIQKQIQLFRIPQCFGDRPIII